MKYIKVFLAIILVLFLSTAFYLIDGLIVAILLLTGLIGLSIFFIFKRNANVISATVLFALVTLQYYWEGFLGMLAFPIFAVLALSYLILLVFLLWNLYRIISQNFTDKAKVKATILVFVLLALIAYKPFGIVDFDRLEGQDLLVARQDGAAGCGVTLKLKEGGKFVERDVCFGVETTRGRYRIKHDTVYFDNVLQEEHAFDMAVIGSFTIDGKTHPTLTYLNSHNTKEMKFDITKNKLNNM